MLNIEKTREALEREVDQVGSLTALDEEYDGDLTGFAEALDEAGTEILDLPEPEGEHWWVGDSTIHRSGQMVTWETFEGESVTVDIDEARKIAFALLAASAAEEA